MYMLENFLLEVLLTYSETVSKGKNVTDPIRFKNLGVYYVHPTEPNLLNLKGYKSPIMTYQDLLAELESTLVGEVITEIDDENELRYVWKSKIGELEVVVVRHELRIGEEGLEDIEIHYGKIRLNSHNQRENGIIFLYEGNKYNELVVWVMMN